MNLFVQHDLWRPTDLPQARGIIIHRRLYRDAHEYYTRLIASLTVAACPGDGGNPQQSSFK